jgi:hypothetical protein
MDHLSETVPTLLPESMLLDFLLQCSALTDLRKYMDMCDTISTGESYEGKPTITFASPFIKMVHHEPISEIF